MQSQANDARNREAIDTGNTLTIDKHQLKVPLVSILPDPDYQVNNSAHFSFPTACLRPVPLFSGGEFKRLTPIPSIYRSSESTLYICSSTLGLSQTLSSRSGTWVSREARAKSLAKMQRPPSSGDYAHVFSQMIPEGKSFPSSETNPKGRDGSGSRGAPQAHGITAYWKYYCCKSLRRLVIPLIQ